LAFELASDEKSGYLHSKRDYIYQKCLKAGVLLRPLGNTIYILPPFIISEEQLTKIYDVIENL
jgi:adenosylmethionine-8-amino-7-oxononanoate aminotransferase